jgi:hypothetical protein
MVGGMFRGSLATENWSKASSLGHWQGREKSGRLLPLSEGWCIALWFHPATGMNLKALKS